MYTKIDISIEKLGFNFLNFYFLYNSFVMYTKFYISIEKWDFTY